MRSGPTHTYFITFHTWKYDLPLPKCGQILRVNVRPWQQGISHNRGRSPTEKCRAGRSILFGSGYPVPFLFTSPPQKKQIQLLGCPSARFFLGWWLDTGTQRWFTMDHVRVVVLSQWTEARGSARNPWGTVRNMLEKLYAIHIEKNGSLTWGELLSSGRGNAPNNATYG